MPILPNSPAKNNRPQNNDVQVLSEVDLLYKIGTDFCGKPQTIRAGIEKLKRAAQKGHPYAYWMIGDIHLDGRQGFPINKKEALKYFELAIAEHQHQVAKFEAGKILFEGDEGIEKDEVKALEYIESAVEHGIAEAQFFLAMLLRQEHRLLPVSLLSRERSAQLIIAAAQKGYAAAETELGLMLLENDTSDPEHKLAVTFFESAANKGNMRAKYYLATMLRDGRGVDQNEEKAARLLQEIVDANYPLSDAYLALGQMYMRGLGVVLFPPKGYELIKKSADQGNVVAMFELIEILRHGQGVSKNAAKSIPYFEQLIENDHPHLKLTLGLMYLKGDEIQQDTEKGLKLLKEYGEHGGKDALYELGTLFNNEKEIPANEELSVHYFEAAAKQGHEDAQYELALWRIYQAEKIFAAIAPKDLEARYQLACIQLNDYSMYDDAIASLRFCADSGHAAAQFKLRWQHLVSARDALQYLYNSGENNFEPALLELARIFEVGEGVEQDKEKAKDYYTRAAQVRSKDAQSLTEPANISRDGSGDVSAQLQLGFCRLHQAEMAFEATQGTSYPQALYHLACIRLNKYKNRDECRKNTEACTAMLIDSANLGYAAAKFKLWCDELVDKKEAVKYLKEAAIYDNYGPALTQLAYEYQIGRDVSQDYKQAKLYYEAAVKQNISYAQFRLANMYNFGWGVTPNSQKAKELYALAAEQGHEQSAFEFAMLDSSLKKLPSTNFQKATRSLERLFNKWLKPLNLLNQHLKSKDSPAYKDVKVIVDQLYTILAKSGKKYFAHIPINTVTIRRFVKHCDAIINEHDRLFETHRGWHASHWLLKWCVGFLACLTVLPAAYIYFKTKAGIKHTFFSSQLPQTATAAEIEKITEDLKGLQKSLIHGMKKPASGGNLLPSIAEEAEDDEPDVISGGPK